MLLSSIGCAGPTTPLGALWSLTPAQPKLISTRSLTESPRSLAKSFEGPTIRFTPDRQVLHGASRIKVTVENLFGGSTGHELSFFYNGYDVTTAFLLQARIVHDPSLRKLVITAPVVRLMPEVEHSIEMYYRNPFGSAHGRLKPPICYAFRPEPIRNLAGFKSDPEVLRSIENHSARADFNSALLAGLIAQESGFNPKAVSWARAVGLTQITPIAEAEVMNSSREWPRYPGLSELPIPLLKAMILQGHINSRNEWRLHPEQSIQGGMEYLRLLSQWWSSKENETRITALFKDPAVAHTQLILASYHSGYSRVLTALQSLGPNWINAPNLNEARKYINRIMSYCSTFTRPGEEV